MLKDRAQNSQRQVEGRDQALSLPKMEQFLEALMFTSLYACSSLRVLQAGIKTAEIMGVTSLEHPLDGAKTIPGLKAGHSGPGDGQVMHLRL